jgi:hypothetical protein
MNNPFLNGFSGSEEDAQRAYLEMMYNYISVNGMGSTKGIDPADARDLLHFVLSNMNSGNDEVEQAMNKEVTLREAAEIETINFPNIHFFRSLYANLEGKITPIDVHLTSFLNVPLHFPVTPVDDILSGTNADGSWDGNSDTDAYQNPDGSWNYSLDPFYSGNSNSSGFNWSSLFNFASNTLSTISNWGKPDSITTVYNPSQTPTVQPTVTPTVTQQQAQGLGTGTIILIGGILVIAAGIIVYVETKKPEAKKSPISGIKNFSINRRRNKKSQ